MEHNIIALLYEVKCFPYDIDYVKRMCAKSRKYYLRKFTQFIMRADTRPYERATDEALLLIICQIGK